MAVPARRADALRPRLVAVERRRVRRAPRRRKRRVPFALFALAVVAVMVTLLTTAQALVAQGSFRVSELSREAARLEAEHEQLRLRVAKLSSPERIAAAARRAGLVIPDRVEVLVVPRMGERG